MNKMDEALLSMYVWMKVSFGNFIEDFKNEERGASDMVAVVVMIVIVVALAGIFNKQLGQVANVALEKVGTFVNETK